MSARTVTAESDSQDRVTSAKSRLSSQRLRRAGTLTSLTNLASTRSQIDLSVAPVANYRAAVSSTEPDVHAEDLCWWSRSVFGSCMRRPRILRVRTLLSMACGTRIAGGMRPLLPRLRRRPTSRTASFLAAGLGANSVNHIRSAGVK